MIQLGDIYFVSGKGWISKAIKWVTRGSKSHVGLVISPKWFFETEGNKGKAGYFRSDKYEPDTIEFWRLKKMRAKDRYKINVACVLYKDAPYSYWDGLVNLLVSPFPGKFRKKATAALGTKKFMKCDELVQRIIFEAMGYTPFIYFESHTPSSLYRMVKSSGDWERVEPE